MLLALKIMGAMCVEIERMDLVVMVTMVLWLFLIGPFCIYKKICVYCLENVVNLQITDNEKKKKKFNK
jgi:hypothetical protein